MNIRLKTLIIVGGAVIVLGFAVYGISQTVLMRGFLEIEEEMVKKDVRRAINSLYNDISVIDFTNYDWSAWDDTYEFIQDKNEEYIESNLINDTFVTIGINVMLYFNSSGQLVFGKSVDLENGTEIQISQDLLDYIEENDILLYHHDIEDNVSGIILLPEKIAMISSRPILTSEDEGPIRGALIMVRYIDENEIKKLSQLTELPIEIYRYNGSKFPKEEILIEPLNQDYIIGYGIIPDVYGNPALMLKINEERDIYERGRITLRYYGFSIIFFGLMLAIAMAILLDKSIVSRLLKLNESVKKIEESGNVSKRVEMHGNDEIANLAKGINDMLESLEKSEKKIKDALDKEKEFKRKTAHYFFNPICIAKGFLKIAKEEGDLKYIEKAINAVDRIEKVVKNIVTKGEISEE